MTVNRLIDRYNRRLNYLRISITDRCNLSCIYCIPQGIHSKLPHEEILSYEEILRLVRICVGLGISKVRVTGGEPLVRKGVFDFLANLNSINGITDVSLTTNGTGLKDRLEQIRSAGIKRINISLDTLNKHKYKKLTGFDKFDEVWEGILSALDKGFHPIKLNVVALKGMNEDELEAFAELSIKYPLHIRFIEYMPIGTSTAEKGTPLLTPEIKESIRGIGKLIPVKNSITDGPAERYRFSGAEGELGFISALSHHFCSTCNRLRLTASGQIRTCLLSDEQVDLKSPLRSGATDHQLAELIFHAAQRKPSRHQLTESDASSIVTTQMSSIGG